MSTKLQKYLSEFVYGGIDGSITTFAVVAGASGAQLESHVVIILGMANLIADGFSMSIGSYLAANSRQLQYEKYKQREYWEIENLRESEVREVRDIFVEKGFEGDLLEKAVNKITENNDHWVDMMMKHELQMIPEQKTSLNIALATFISFVLAGFIPLFIYVFDFLHPQALPLFLISSVLTGLAFVGIGLLKGFMTRTNRLRRAAETLLLGVIAASLAYFAGYFLEKIIL